MCTAQAVKWMSSNATQNVGGEAAAAGGKLSSSVQSRRSRGAVRVRVQQSGGSVAAKSVRRLAQTAVAPAYDKQQQLLKVCVCYMGIRVVLCMLCVYCGW